MAGAFSSAFSNAFDTGGGGGQTHACPIASITVSAILPGCKKSALVSPDQLTVSCVSLGTKHTQAVTSQQLTVSCVSLGTKHTISLSIGTLTVTPVNPNPVHQVSCGPQQITISGVAFAGYRKTVSLSAQQFHVNLVGFGLVADCPTLTITISSILPATRKAVAAPICQTTLSGVAPSTSKQALLLPQVFHVYPIIVDRTIFSTRIIVNIESPRLVINIEDPEPLQLEGS